MVPSSQYSLVIWVASSLGLAFYEKYLQATISQDLVDGFRRGILILCCKLLLSIPYGERVCSRFGIFTSSRRSAKDSGHYPWHVFAPAIGTSLCHAPLREV